MTLGRLPNGALTRRQRPQRRSENGSRPVGLAVQQTVPGHRCFHYGAGRDRASCTMERGVPRAAVAPCTGLGWAR